MTIMFLDTDFRAVRNHVRGITPEFLIVNKVFEYFVDRIKSGWNNRNVITSLESIIKSLQSHLNPTQTYTVNNTYNIEALLNYPVSERYYVVPIVRALLISLNHHNWDVTQSINAILDEINIKYGRKSNYRYGKANIKLLRSVSQSMVTPINKMKKNNEEKQCEEKQCEAKCSMSNAIESGWCCRICQLFNDASITFCAECKFKKGSDYDWGFSKDEYDHDATIYFQYPPANLEGKSPKYFATLTGISHMFDFDELADVKKACTWLQIDWKLVQYYMKNFETFMPPQIDCAQIKIQEIIQNVIENEWSNNTQAWIKYYVWKMYGRKDKILDILNDKVLNMINGTDVSYTQRLKSLNLYYG
eukprot:449741_1